MQHARRTARARGWRSVLLGFTAVLACQTDPISEPESSLSAAKGSGGGGLTSVTVTAADPDTIPTDTTLTVKIYGSGFTPGTNTVTYLFNNQVSSKVVASAVQYVSATELSTTTTVARGAAIGAYDIAVTSNGKRGIGAERMEVVVKTVLLPDYGFESNVFDINDALVAVGFAVDKTGSRRAMRWVPDGAGWSKEDLGPGMALAVNRWGDIAGFTNDGATDCSTVSTSGGRTCRAWIRLASGTTFDLGPIYDNGGSSLWSESRLRLSDNGTVLANYLIPGGSAAGTPTARVQTGSNIWGEPALLPLPSGMTGSSIGQDLSPDGEWIVGEVQPAAGYQIPGTAWRRSMGGWTPLVVDAGQGSSVVQVQAVRSSGSMAGRVRSCNGPGCTNPSWTLVAWTAPGAAQVLLAGCVLVALNRSHVSDMNEAGHIVGDCHLPSGRGKKTVYQVTQLFWRSPTTSPIPLSLTGYVWAINDAGVAAGRDRAQSAAYCIDPYGSTADGCHAAIWLLP